MATGLRSNADSITTRQIAAPATGPAPDSSPPTGNVPLANVSNADDLKAIEALTGTSGSLHKTAANMWALRQNLDTTDTPQFARLGIGTTADANNPLMVVAQAAANRASGYRYFADDANGFALHLRKGRGTQASPATVQSADVVGDFNFEGYFNNAAINDKPCARLRVIAAENWSSTAVGCALTLMTAITGGTSALERARISSAGNLLIGGTADTGLTGVGGLRVFSTTEATNAAGSGIFDGGLLVKKALFVNSATATTSGTTGALVCAGGVGVAGKLYVADTTEASHTGPAGAVITLGGIYATKKVISATEFDVAANKVVGARVTGWGAPTGTATRTSFATHAAQTISAVPTQAEVQNIDNSLVLVATRLKALIDDLTTHGLIGA